MTIGYDSTQPLNRPSSPDSDSEPVNADLGPMVQGLSLSSANFPSPDPGPAACEPTPTTPEPQPQSEDEDKESDAPKLKKQPNSLAIALRPLGLQGYGLEPPPAPRPGYAQLASVPDFGSPPPLPPAPPASPVNAPTSFLVPPPARVERVQQPYRGRLVSSLEFGGDGSIWLTVKRREHYDE